MLRILYADDHKLVRAGITQIIRDDYPTAHITEVGNAEELIEKVLKEEWDLILSDIDMPGRSGLDALKQIKLLRPRVPVLFVSIFPEALYAIRALKGGAAGYLNKDAAPEELITAIQRILQGRTYVTPSVSERLISEIKKDSDKQPHELLSNREMEVFLLLVQGKSLTQIAEMLFLNITTISTYRTKLLQKLGCSSNAEVVMYALRHKFIKDVS